MERLFVERTGFSVMECVLYDRECCNCGECLRCDLNPEKICDNCGQCLETHGKEYNELKIDRVVLDSDEYARWLREEGEEE